MTTHHSSFRTHHSKRAIYPAYKPSSMPWLGEIPEHWGLKRMKYVSKTIMGQSPNSDAYTLDETSRPFLQGNAEFGARHPVPKYFCDAAMKEAPEGALLISVRAPVGALNMANQSYGIGRGLCAIVADNASLLPSFAWHALPITRHELWSIATGSTYEAVSADEVAAMTTAIPPLDEQKAIAAFLDRETARIDALIEKKRRQIELLQEKRSALISHAVTKGLGGMRNDECGMMNGKDADAHDPSFRTQDFKDSGIDWLGNVPTSWHHRKLGYIATMSGGCTPSKSNEEYWRGTIPWVSPKDMKKRCIDDSEDHVSEDAVRETGLRLLEPPVVLIVVRGMILTHTFPVGLTTSPVTINQDMKALRPQRGVIADYLAFLLEGISRVVLSHVDESAHGTKCLRTDLWKNISVFIPDEQEQLDICAHLHEQLRKIDDLIKRVDESAALLREHRSALISAAVTGKIDVREEVA